MLFRQPGCTSWFHFLDQLRATLKGHTLGCQVVAAVSSSSIYTQTFINEQLITLNKPFTKFDTHNLCLLQRSEKVITMLKHTSTLMSPRYILDGT